MNLYSSQDISPLMSGIHINPANICWNPVMTGIQHLVSLTVQSTHSLRNPAIQDWVDTVEAQRRDARHVINLVKQWDSIRDRCQSLCMPVCGKGLKRVWTQRSTTFPWPRLKQQNSSSGSSDGQASRARHKLCSTSDGCTTITSHASSRVASYHLPAQSAQFVSGHLALSSLSLQRPVIPRTADGSVSRDALWNIPPPKALLTALETVHWGALFNMLWPSVQQ